MIRNIMGSQGIIVMGGSTSAPYVNMSNPSAGMVRYNGNNQNFEVYDGSSWMTFSSNSATVELSGDTKELLEWARAKRAEEEYLQREAEKNPTISDLLHQKKKIDEQIVIIKKLIEPEVKV